MSRIKFLDVLEETKTKPIYNHKTTEEYSIPKKEEIHSSYRERPVRNSRTIENEKSSSPSLASLREKTILRDSAASLDSRYMSRRSVTENANPQKYTQQASSNTNTGIEDNRVLWTGALFVLFGGMLFLSGYWVGKTITGNVRAEKEVLIAQSSMNNMKMNSSDSSLSLISQPMASTLDTIPLPQKPMKVVEPAIAPVPKNVPKPTIKSKEYVIQVSAHSTIESARLVEDQLRVAGFSAYTSESTIGDAVFFRVRLRGFTSKNEAQSTLSKIKSANLGKDGFVLTLE
ncbi:MAG: SPOR domain-containing protein [Spirochaetota bacterium]|nr:SPOR domain-containing protein [Spirochaetota bacterium]